MSHTRLTHFAQVFRSMGGVESMLRHHHERDALHGIDSHFVAYQEDGSQPVERVSFLGLNDRSTIRQARRRFEEAVALAPPETAVYHSLWGMTYWADLDRAQRRIMVLHTDAPGMEGPLRLRGEWLDGVLCVSEALRGKVSGLLPSLGADRVGRLHCPIVPGIKASQKAPFVGRPVVLGMCGRMIFEQKRVDRVPALVAELDRAGVDYRFEFLGEGPDQGWLERELSDRKKFIFHGRKSGVPYWQALDEWDVIVSLSDYEGTPISLLEAMCLGAIPVYPRIDSGGDGYVSSVRPDLLYEAGNLASLAALVKSLRGLAPAETEALRRRSVQAVEPHLGNNYLSGFARFVQKVAEAPRVARDTFPKRPWPVDHLPLNWVGKLGLMRQRLLRLKER